MVNHSVAPSLDAYDKLSDIPTINDVSFQIPEGKVTAIVGLTD